MDFPKSDRGRAEGLGGRCFFFRPTPSSYTNVAGWQHLAAASSIRPSRAACRCAGIHLFGDVGGGRGLPLARMGDGRAPRGGRRTFFEPCPPPRRESSARCFSAPCRSRTRSPAPAVLSTSSGALFSATQPILNLPPPFVPSCRAGCRAGATGPRRRADGGPRDSAALITPADRGAHGRDCRRSPRPPTDLATKIMTTRRFPADGRALRTT